MFFLTELPTRQMVESYTEDLAGVDASTVQAALAMMRRASQLVRKLDAFFAAHKLSQLRFLVLIVIDREPDRDTLTASEIAARLDVSKPILSRAIKSLREEGLLRATEDKQDSRARNLALTRTARRKLDQLLPGYFRLICEFMHTQQQ
jgi:DNA-binding MarR family transcriptional regulator